MSSQPFGSPECLIEIGAGKSQHELIAAVARGEAPGVVGCVLEHRRDLTQDAAAGLMTVLVVDPLEVVEVEEQQAHVLASVLGVRYCGGESVVESAAVQETREAVPTLGRRFGTIGDHAP